MGRSSTLLSAVKEKKPVQPSKKRKIEEVPPSTEKGSKSASSMDPTPKRSKKSTSDPVAPSKSILKQTTNPNIEIEAQVLYPVPEITELTPKKTKMRKPKAERVKLQPASVKAAPAGLNGTTPNFLSYLDRYHNNKSEWKFNKALQTHVLKNVFHPQRIPNSYNEAVVSYITSLQGIGARSRLLEEARTTIKELDVALLEVLANQMDNPETQRQALQDALQRDLDKVKNAQRESDLALHHSSAEYLFKLNKRLRAEAVIGALGHEVPTSATEEQSSKNSKRRRKIRTGGIPDDEDLSDSSSSSSSSSSASASSSASSSSTDEDSDSDSGPTSNSNTSSTMPEVTAQATTDSHTTDGSVSDSSNTSASSAESSSDSSSESETEGDSD